jgi:hypothetical protein
MEKDDIIATVKEQSKPEGNSDRIPWIQVDSKSYFLKSDVHCVALAPLSIVCSPRSFFFDERRGELYSDLFDSATSFSYSMTSAVESFLPYFTVSRNRDLFAKAIERSNGAFNATRFSHTASEALYQLDNLLQKIPRSRYHPTHNWHFVPLQ